MANSRLSFVIAIKLLTDNFSKGTSKVKAQLLTMQRNFLALASAVGAGTIGLTNFVSKMIEVAKESSRANIALKNISGSAAEFANSQKWLLEVANRYGVEINSLTSGFAKFKAAADISNMSLDDQRKIFESVARASVAFGLSAEDQRGVFMALSQMMSKNKVMAEELRLQLAERLPVAIQAMAKAAGVSVNELDSMMKQGKVLSSEVLPKFADALNSMIANPNTDNLNKSLVDLSNTFTQLTKNLGIEEKFKSIVEAVTGVLKTLAANVDKIVGGIKLALMGMFGKGLTAGLGSLAADYDKAVASAVKAVEGGQRAINRVQKTQEAYNLAIAEKAEAEKLLAAAVSAEERKALEERVVAANKLVKEKEGKHFKAVEAQKIASSKATAEQVHYASLKGVEGWDRNMNIIKHTVARAWASIKSIVAANIWSAAIAGLLSILNLLRKNVETALAAKRAFQALGDVAPTDEMKELTQWQGYLNDSEQDVREGALQKINEILGTQLTFEDDINTVIDRRLALLRAEEKRRKAIESIKANEEAKKGKDVGGVAYDERIRRSQVEKREAELEIARLTGVDIRSTATTSNTPDGTAADPIKVEVVNLDLEDIEQESFEDFVDRINQQIGGTTPRFADPTVIAAITSRQRDKSRDWSMSDVEILEAEKVFAQEKVNMLLNYAEEAGVELGNVLSEAIANSVSLSEALRLGEIDQAVKEAQQTLQDVTLKGIEGAANDVDRLVDAFDNLNEVMADDTTAWEKLMAVFNIFTSTMQAIVSVIETVTKAREAAAMVERASAAEIVGANTAEAASETGKNVAKQAPGYAALIAVPAAIAAIVAAFSMIPKFAKGGIVGGSSTHGDKVLARLNSGEGVLTPEGLESLHDAANPRNRRAVEVMGRLMGRGRDLVAVIGNENKFKGRIG